VYRILLGTSESIAGTVYGTIVVMGAIVAGAHGVEDLWRLDAIVAGTVVVLWLAHVYAHGLGESIQLRRRLDRAEFFSVSRRELAIALAAVGPVVALSLGALEVIRSTRAVWLALGIGLFTLAVQGYRYARLEELSRWGTIASVALNLGLGLGLVGLKVVVGH
jgi:hypothetical protein